MGTKQLFYRFARHPNWIASLPDTFKYGLWFYNVLSLQKQTDQLAPIFNQKIAHTQQKICNKTKRKKIEESSHLYETQRNQMNFVIEKSTSVLPIRIEFNGSMLFNNYEGKTALLHVDTITTQFRTNDSGFWFVTKIRAISFFFLLLYFSHGSLSAFDVVLFYTLFAWIFLSNLKYFSNLSAHTSPKRYERWNGVSPLFFSFLPAITHSVGCYLLLFGVENVI